MNEIKFSCPHCTQHIACDASYAGQQIDCPVCGRGLLVPHPMTLREREPETAPAPSTEHSTTPRAEPWSEEDWNRHMSVYYRLRLLTLAGGSRLGYWFWGIFLGPLLLFLVGVTFRQSFAMSFLRAIGTYLLGGLLPDEVADSTEFWSNPFFYVLVVSAAASGFLLAKICARNAFTLVICSMVFTFFVLGVDLFVCCVGGCLVAAGSFSNAK